MTDQSEKKSHLKTVFLLERAKHALSFKEAAAKIRISPSYLRAIETGERIPSLKVCARICRAYGLDPREYIAIALTEKYGEVVEFLQCQEMLNPVLLHIIREIEKLPDQKRTRVIEIVMETIALARS